MTSLELSIFPAATLCCVILENCYGRAGAGSQVAMNHLVGHHEKEVLHAWHAISHVAEPWIGGLMCMLAAFAATALAAGHAWEVWVPLLFNAVIFLIALVFGVRAGLLGTLLAALVFAVFLFPPTGRIEVADPAARTNLGWMMLTGIAFSFLFAPSGSRFRRRRAMTTERGRAAS